LRTTTRNGRAHRPSRDSLGVRSGVR
jgi:hypothetical protein